MSARAVRARLAYETWFYLHLYTYLAIALAFSNQLATGADFVASLRNRVLDVRPDAPGVVSVTLRGEHLDELHTLQLSTGRASERGAST